MPLSPSEVQQQKSLALRIVVNSICNLIDAELPKRYNDSGVFKIWIDNKSPEAVYNEVVKVYKAAGWKHSEWSYGSTGPSSH